MTLALGCPGSDYGWEMIGERASPSPHLGPQYILEFTGLCVWEQELGLTFGVTITDTLSNKKTHSVLPVGTVPPP